MDESTNCASITIPLDSIYNNMPLTVSVINHAASDEIIYQVDIPLTYDFYEGVGQVILTYRF